MGSRHGSNVDGRISPSPATEPRRYRSADAESCPVSNASAPKWQPRYSQNGRDYLFPKESTASIADVTHNNVKLQTPGEKTGARRRRATPEANKDPKYKYAAHAVIWFAITVTVVMQELAGWSLPLGFSELHARGLPPAPERGDLFQQGSPTPVNVTAALQQAAAVGWQGATADAYADANATLKALTLEMADLDAKMADYTNHQAEAVNATQLGIGIVLDILLATYTWCWSMEIGLANILMLFIFACAFATAMIAAALLQLMICSSASEFNKNKANAIHYSGVAQAARSVGKPCTAERHQSNSATLPTSPIEFTGVRNNAR